MLGPQTATYLILHVRLVSAQTLLRHLFQTWHFEPLLSLFLILLSSYPYVQLRDFRALSREMVSNGYPAHEGLQFIEPSSRHGGPELLMGNASEVVPLPISSDDKEVLPDTEKEAVGEPTSVDRTVFGLRRKTFWLVLGIVCLLVAIAVGGGIGGALSKRNSDRSRYLPQCLPIYGAGTHPNSKLISGYT